MSAPQTPCRIEPCFLESYPAELGDLVAELSERAAILGARLHPATASSLAELVRVMNCYYSNLIEGHDTRPRDIEAALANQLVEDGTRRDLQLEARAHIRVQREIDRLVLGGSYGEPAAVDRIQWLHREFYRDASPRMLHIQHHEGDYALEPGAFRSEPRHDVSVGRHLPPSSARVDEFMAYFAQRYRFAGLGKSRRLVAMAAAHHRLNFIHPFVDGNGRVSRLMSHAMALEAGVGAHGLWSISRGLARGIAGFGDYKRMMDLADEPRQGDLDGRGNLSLKALTDFVIWFLRVALDQVSFMTSLFDLDALSLRLTNYVRLDLQLNDVAVAMAQQVLQYGELARGAVAQATGKPERTARQALSELVAAGLFVSDTPKGPVRLHFSSASAGTLFPRLFG